jgi:molecular chaperone Hsp33
LANLPESAGTILRDGSMLLMMRTLANGELHQGMVEVRHARGLSDALMTYMQDSEQVRSTIDVGTLVKDGEVVAAGGYLVQLLPELSESVLAVMTERLPDFPPMAKLLEARGATPEQVMAELLYGIPYAVTGTSLLRFACNCSHVRVVAGLSTLGRDEIASLVEQGEVLEISCDFCGKDYRVAPEQLEGLLKPN